MPRATLTNVATAFRRVCARAETASDAENERTPTWSARLHDGAIVCSVGGEAATRCGCDGARGRHAASACAEEGVEQ
jgi:hypothetical protein